MFIGLTGRLSAQDIQRPMVCLQIATGSIDLSGPRTVREYFIRRVETTLNEAPETEDFSDLSNVEIQLAIPIRRGSTYSVYAGGGVAYLFTKGRVDYPNSGGRAADRQELYRISVGALVEGHRRLTTGLAGFGALKLALGRTVLKRNYLLPSESWADRFAGQYEAESIPLEIQAGLQLVLDGFVARVHFGYEFDRAAPLENAQRPYTVGTGGEDLKAPWSGYRIGVQLGLLINE